MIKNPFPAQGVSEYPLKSPFIGQENIYKSLKNFKNECFSEINEHFFILRGDWGEGKSRIGHEIVAQCLDETKGWYFKNQINTQKRIFSKEDKILPLFIPFREVWTGRYEPIEKELMPIFIIRAFEFTLNQNINIVKNIQNYLRSINENLFENLKLIITQASKNLEEKANKLVSFTLEKFDFKKIFIIFDEVETPGDLEYTIEEQLRTTELKYELVEIQMTARKIKESVSMNIAIFENVNFFFLCSLDAYTPFENIAALERRVKYHFISKNNYGDFLFYIQILEDSYESISRLFNKHLISAIYIITDGNFGWFNFLSSSLFFQLRDTPDLGVPELLREVLHPNELLFDNNIIETILTQKDLPEIPNFDLLLYDYLPRNKSDIPEPERLLKFDTAYGKVFTNYLKIKTTPGDLLKKLKDDKGFGVEREGIGSTAKLKLITQEHKRLPQNIIGFLKIFPDLNTSDEFFIYSDFEQFKIYFNYCLKEDYPINVIKPIYDTLITFALNEEYIGLAFEFLLLINIRMKIKSQKKIWLYRNIWDEIIKSIEKLDPRKKREKMMVGFVNLLLFIDKKPEKIYKNEDNIIENLDKYAYYYYIKNLSKKSILNTTHNTSLLLLYLKSSNYVDLFNILEKHIGQKGICPIIIIFNTDKEMLDANNVLKQYPDLESCWISYIISTGSIEYDFFVKLGYYNNMEIIDDPLQFTKEDITDFSLIENNSEVFREKIENWKKRLEDSGNLLKPMRLYSNRLNPTRKILFTTEDLIRIFEFIYKDKSQSFSSIITSIWSTTELRNKTRKNITVEFEDNYFKQLDYLSPIILLSEEREFEPGFTTFKLNFPSVFLKILKIVSIDRAKVSDIAERLFYLLINYAGADEMLSGPPLLDILGFLEHFFIINKDSNNKYGMINRSHIDKISKEARTYIDILLDENSNDSIKKIEEIVGRTILINLKIHDANLKVIQDKILNLVNKETSQLLNDFFTKETDEIIDILFKLKEIPSQLNIYIAENIKQIDISTEPEDLKSLLKEFNVNEISEEYTLADRINFIKKLIEYYDEIYKEAISHLNDSESKIKSQYSKINGKDFPLETTILSKFQEIRSDLNYEVEENPKIRGDLNIKTSLKILRESGDLISMVTIFENYISVVNALEDELIELFTDLENNFFDKWDDLSSKKESLEKYLQNASSYKTELDDINALYIKLLPYYSEFRTQPDVSTVQFEELKNLKENIIKNLKELEEKIENTEKNAINDIQKKIDETEISYLKELERRLQKIEFEAKEVWECETYLEQVQVVENLPNTIRERAINYLNSDHFWDSFKEIIGKLLEGVNHEEIYQQHRQDFEEFKEANLNMFKIEIEIKII